LRVLSTTLPQNAATSASLPAAKKAVEKPRKALYVLAFPPELRYKGRAAEAITMRTSCPPDPDEIAEASLLGTLSREENSLFARHIEECSYCRRILEFNRGYVAAMKEAASQYVASGATNPPKLKAAMGDA
jgi:hypothetical protein